MFSCLKVILPISGEPLHTTSCEWMAHHSVIHMVNCNATFVFLPTLHELQLTSDKSNGVPVQMQRAYCETERNNYSDFSKTEKHCFEICEKHWISLWISVLGNVTCSCLWWSINGTEKVIIMKIARMYVSMTLSIYVKVTTSLNQQPTDHYYSYILYIIYITYQTELS